MQNLCFNYNKTIKHASSANVLHKIYNIMLVEKWYILEDAKLLNIFSTFILLSSNKFIYHFLVTKWYKLFFLFLLVRIQRLKNIGKQQMFIQKQHVFPPIQSFYTSQYNQLYIHSHFFYFHFSKPLLKRETARERERLRGRERSRRDVTGTIVGLASLRLDFPIKIQWLWKENQGLILFNLLFSNT